MKTICIGACLLALLLAGCSGEGKDKKSAQNNGEDNPPGPVPLQKLPPHVQPPAEQPPSEVAGVGAGKKGRNYGGGLITEPASQYWKAKERIVFTVQIPNAMKLYKPLNNFKGPQSHEEFMEKIIKANGIRLPELPPGKKYVYDVEKETLMIERAAAQ